MADAQQYHYEPPVERLKTYCRVVGPSDRPITFALYRTPAGLEVRGAVSTDEIVFAHYVMNEQDADAYAEDWMAMLRARGSFRELPFES
jgi:hypothetical protein